MLQNNVDFFVSSFDIATTWIIQHFTGSQHIIITIDQFKASWQQV